MSIETQREVERKYDIPEGASDPDLGMLGSGLRAGEPKTETLVAEYFDTPELAVRSARCTLRRRTGGGDEGWHLKRPRQGDERVELHAPIGEASRVPSQLRAELASVVGDRPLLPLVELVTERTTTELFDGERVVAVVCADAVRARVLRIGDERDAEWREFEVELVGDADERTVFPAVEAVLFGAGLITSEHRSKVVRALTGVAPQPVPTATDSAGAVVVHLLASHFGQFQAFEALARSDEPDAVHQARVALRTMRSILKSFGALFDDDAVEALVEELRWAGQVLAGPRDAEVVRDAVGASLKGLPGAAAARMRVQSWTAEQHEEEFARFLAEVDRERWTAVHEALLSFLTRPPLRASAERVAAGRLLRLTRRATERVERRADRAGKKPAELERWHEVRKAAKAVRYALEAIDEVPGARVKRQRKAWKALAKALGEVQDAALIDETLQAFSERAATEAPEIVTTLDAARERIAGRLEARLAQARALLDGLV